jgi:hypothetical protein
MGCFYCSEKIPGADCLPDKTDSAKQGGQVNPWLAFLLGLLIGGLAGLMVAALVRANDEKGDGG